MIVALPLFVKSADVGRGSVLLSPGHRRGHVSADLSKSWVIRGLDRHVKVESGLSTQRGQFLLLLHVKFLLDSASRGQRSLCSLNGLQHIYI